VCKLNGLRGTGTHVIFFAAVIVVHMSRAYLHALRPTTEAIRSEYARGFWEKSGFPNVVAAVDVSHVRMTEPDSRVHFPKEWIGRDGKPSMCIQVRVQFSHESLFGTMISPYVPCRRL